MAISVSRVSACRANYAEHLADREMFQREFCRRLGAEPGLNGKVLDIGCGSDLPLGMLSLKTRLQTVDLDGVDPTPGVMSHPLLRRRWQGEFETAPIPDGEYDVAYAYNVVEHIREADSFFARLRRVLKPGGVFWALTPHGAHPFAAAVRLVQVLKLKHGIAMRNKGVNDYPAYYRLNTPSKVAKAAERNGFANAEFVHVPCMQWDRYFPRPLRGLPHLYDRLFGLNFRRASLLLMYRLQ